MQSTADNGSFGSTSGGRLYLALEEAGPHEDAVGMCVTVVLAAHAEVAGLAAVQVAAHPAGEAGAADETALQHGAQRWVPLTC